MKVKKIKDQELKNNIAFNQARWAMKVPMGRGVIAKHLGITAVSLNRKIAMEYPFTFSEIEKLKKLMPKLRFSIEIGTDKILLTFKN